MKYQQRCAGSSCRGYTLISVFAFLCMLFLATGCRSTPTVGIYNVIFEDKSLGWCKVRLMKTNIDGKAIRVEVVVNDMEVVQLDVVDDEYLINSTQRQLTNNVWESINVLLNRDGTWKVFRGIIGNGGSVEMLYNDMETPDAY